MVTPLNPELFRLFPKLRKSNHKINSSPSYYYNCFAYVVGKRKQVWWPNEHGYWPAGCSRAETVSAFVEVLKTFGFSECKNGNFEAGQERIAIYANKDGVPQHVALQPTNRKGMWVSKLGDEHDIIHELNALEDGDYGCVVKYLKRAKKRKPKGRRRSA